MSITPRIALKVGSLNMKEKTKTNNSGGESQKSMPKIKQKKHLRTRQVMEMDQSLGLF